VNKFCDPVTSFPAGTTLTADPSHRWHRSQDELDNAVGCLFPLVVIQMDVRLDATFALSPIDQIPDEVEDNPKPGVPLVNCFVLYCFTSY